LFYKISSAMTIKATSNQKDGSAICARANLPFVQEDAEASKLTKDTASAKVKTNLRKISGTESPREIIQWTNNLLKQVFPGMGLTTGAGQKAVLNTVTTGNTHFIVAHGTHSESTAERLRRALVANVDVTHTNHLAVLAQDLDSPDNLTTRVIGLTIFEIIESMMPQHSLVKVQCYLQHECRKPADVQVRDYFQRLVFINTQELTLLPPFRIPVGDQFAQSFSDGDLIDIPLFATPKKWQREMD
jgi:hypothetical protein